MFFMGQQWFIYKLILGEFIGKKQGSRLFIEPGSILPFLTFIDD